MFLTGTAGGSLDANNGMKFRTKDVDNDVAESKSCAQQNHGAWWFRSCTYSHLNGEYLGGIHHQHFKGVLWFHFKRQDYSYKVAKMKVGGDQN